MILRGSTFSKMLEMETGITVVASNKINMDESCKVVYLLHGLCGNNGDWTNYTMLPVYANDYNAIFIMPEIARSFCSDMKYGHKFFSYITDELPSICKRVFNISSNRDNTIIIGDSMGGYGALKWALSKPEQYGYCCAFSSPCLFLREDLNKHGSAEKFRKAYGEHMLRDFQGIFGADLQWSHEHEILELAKKVSKGPVKPKIYSACGTEDFLRSDNARFDLEMQKLDLDFVYEEWPGKHDWYFFNEALKRAFNKSVEINFSIKCYRVFYL
ncbi:alpha/beta hydrolase [Ruminiclostridium josui]|uniref:alpha/beta hydrolase n=1 Tax=Ruminiclostridium josui TaxID=1499 RepID=UPI000466965F|nr:alpha/beta hydrolase family protein [Ruminiclostridium josui]